MWLSFMMQLYLMFQGKAQLLYLMEDPLFNLPEQFINNHNSRCTSNNCTHLYSEIINFNRNVNQLRINLVNAAGKCLLLVLNGNKNIVII